MDERCMIQSELAERWQISEATLERWRTEAGGPLFLKLGNQVRYRVQDVEAFEAEMLRASTKPHGEVIQATCCRLLHHPVAPAAVSHHHEADNLLSAVRATWLSVDWFNGLYERYRHAVSRSASAVSGF